MTHYDYSKDFASLREEAREAIIEALQDYEGNYCDFHNQVFNEDYYECYTDRAKEQLNELGGYSAVSCIVQYEQEEFGEVNTDLSDPCNVLNMLWYIVGDDEIYSLFDGCEKWDEFWNEEATETENKMLMQWLRDNERI